MFISLLTYLYRYLSLLIVTYRYLSSGDALCVLRPSEASIELVLSTAYTLVSTEENFQNIYYNNKYSNNNSSNSSRNSAGNSTFDTSSCKYSCDEGVDDEFVNFVIGRA